ncbi:hypothetical protein JI739_23930 [Ramlibacter sp. AW1]|uniref:Uncharacterized protein n=1 Tax=Ramlibacter aurantiacus TaxID=2801330 RepID=A0A936ZP99_9BURK|nr:beta-1,6-N-acetylglucosaminyltransferase [Ramlibacter aurantiacus]MBL0423407.1 hypothetical protein [Ramlibacter aurantiacus]
MYRDDMTPHGPRPPRILFVVMSAVAPAATVDQLARALAPHRVLVHHDFSQQPSFRLASPNVSFVTDPKRTGWGVFGFVDGIFHSLRQALAEHDFDYLQLLSPSCLPIKPVSEFEAYVQGAADAHFDCIDILEDRDALMSVGYRAFTAEGSFLHRLTRRLANEFFGQEYGRRDEAGIWLRTGGRRGVVPWMALRLMRVLSVPTVGRHLFNDSFRPYYGSTWFGARRHVVRRMIEGFDVPGVREQFSRMRIAEEFLVPTLLMQAGGVKGPINHYVHVFDEAHPGQLVEEHVEMLRASPAYFARKFPAEVGTRVRWRVLSELCRCPMAAAVSAPESAPAPRGEAAAPAQPDESPAHPVMQRPGSAAA